MERGLTVFLCLVGVLCVSYGMMNPNNVIFIIGIMCIIGGYILIRKNLKASIEEKQE